MVCLETNLKTSLCVGKNPSLSSYFLSYFSLVAYFPQVRRPKNHPSEYFYFVFLFNKVVSPRRFMFYFIFCVVVVLSMFGLSSFYRPLVCCWLVTTWYCSSSCCDVLSMMAIQTSKTNLISRKYQIMIINMLKN